VLHLFSNSEQKQEKKNFDKLLNFQSCTPVQRSVIKFVDGLSIPSAGLSMRAVWFDSGTSMMHSIPPCFLKRSHVHYIFGANMGKHRC